MIDIPDFIYPKDENGNALCPKCKKRIAVCDCPVIAPKPSKSIKIIPKVHLDKSGRKGKVVTVIQNLPSKEAFLKDLAKKLKTKTGSGGTFYVLDGQGTIEIQGDHQLTVKRFLI